MVKYPVNEVEETVPTIDNVIQSAALFIIYFSWQGASGQPFFQALAGGAKGLISQFSWNSNDFRVRWGRIGKIIH